MKKRFPHLPWIAQLKCMRCPYHRGYIKCVRNPCIECMQSGRKTHPFGNWKANGNDSNR